MDEKKLTTPWASYPQAMASAIETRGKIVALGESLSARAALLRAAHGALAALKSFEAVMVEHEDADIGEGLARPLIAIRARLEGTADFMADRLPPVERTPEVVLRAMLRAYEARAETLGVAYYAAEKDEDCARDRSVVADNACGVVREMLFMLRAGMAPMPLGPIGADYEARLRGDRPLDAPPLEVP